MVINKDLNLFKQFISRDLGFEIVVLVDLLSPDLLINPFDLFRIGFRYHSVICLNRTNVWNQIIEDYTIHTDYPIFILHYRENQLAVIPLQNYQDLCDSLDELLPQNPDE